MKERQVDKEARGYKSICCKAEIKVIVRGEWRCSKCGLRQLKQCLLGGRDVPVVRL